MIATLASLTFRALLNRRRTLLLGLLGALIVVVALRSSGWATQATGSRSTFTGRLLANFGVAALLPLVTVIVATAALGSSSTTEPSCICSPSRSPGPSSCSSSSWWRGR